MDFEDTPDEAAFREEVRSFLSRHAQFKDPGAWNDNAPVDVQASRAWQRKKADAGLAGILLPRDYGGRGGTPIEQVIYDQEEERYRTPPGRVFMITFGMCIPTMIAFAAPEQSARHASAAIRGDEIWCQLFSEPSGGSDLAGLRTRAERRGDNWVINGQKVWTSGAQFSDYGLLLARTDPTVPKHAGLTAFFVDMKSPGIDVRPIRQIDGEAHFNEVFFDDVIIPDAQRLGEPGAGWKVALFTLMNERVAVSRVDGPDFDELVTAARLARIGGVPAIENAAVRGSLADWYTSREGQRYTLFRVLTALSQGRLPGPEASILKLAGASQFVANASATLDLFGPAGIMMDSDLVPLGGYFERLFLRAPGERIGGGTEEIMLNIIAERVLKLPGDIRPDKDVPFHQLGAAPG